jgi:holo-[acyl-carrier protein] synthase
MLLSGDKMICGTGIDLVEVQRIEKILKRWGERFTGRVYSESEIEYCRKRSNPAIHYAARFAAKEAFLKSIGVRDGVRLKDIEVLNNQGGKPDLKLHNKAKVTLKDNDIHSVHLSISHTDRYATVVVILERKVTS